MDLGSLFSGLGFTPAGSSNPASGAATNTSHMGNWIIIIIMLIVVFRYSNLLPWFFPPAYNTFNSPVEDDKELYKKHHKHHKKKTIFYNPYIDYSLYQNSFGG